VRLLHSILLSVNAGVDSCGDLLSLGVTICPTTASQNLQGARHPEAVDFQGWLARAR